MLTTNSETVVPESTYHDWVCAHEALSRLALKRAAQDAEEGRWLLLAFRAEAHAHLGFGSFGEYIERLFGYKPRSTQEKLRVAEALEELPATAAALETGALNWSAVRELTRVAVAETEQAWLEAAQGKTVHQLEALVAGKERGATPNSASNPEAIRHVLRFQVAPETLCLFREALNHLQHDSGASLDDDSTLMLMARHVLGGPSEAGRASYQIALSICPACSQGSQLASGELVPVGADIVGMGECDGQHLGVLPVADAHTGAHAAAHSDLEVQASAHTGAHAERELAQRAPRAKQAIPPATRRTVLRRDQQRCRVPGCRHSRFLDLHHVQLRSEGGGNQAAGLVTLCGAHHRAAHRGELLVTGSASEGVTFRHADGSDYGKVRDPRALEVHSQVFSALRGLGFREGDARRVLSEVCKNLGEQPPNPARLLREAVGHLTRLKQALAGAQTAT